MTKTEIEQEVILAIELREIVLRTITRDNREIEKIDDNESKMIETGALTVVVTIDTTIGETEVPETTALLTIQDLDDHETIDPAIGEKTMGAHLPTHLHIHQDHLHRTMVDDRIVEAALACWIELRWEPVV
jgi:hypothetical protein